MSAPSVRVVKLGGSLLDWPEMPAAFQSWLVAEPPAHNIVVVGGGEIVEQLRKLDQVHAFESDTAHWLAIRAMSLTAAMAAHLLPGSALIKARADLRLNGEAGSEGGSIQVFDVESFLRAEQGSAGALPSGWHVTSDSIAAHVARAVKAELVLVKSTLPPENCDLDSLARTGFVDSYFPAVADGLAVRIVDLRQGRTRAISLD